MNDLLAIAAQNTIAACILGILVLGLTRLWRRPPVAHILWLLVLVKLIGPPVLHFELTRLLSHRPTIEPRDGRPDLRRESNFPGADPSTSLASLQGSVSRDGETHKLLVNDKDKPGAASSTGAQLVTLKSMFTTARNFAVRHAREALIAVFITWIAGLAFCASIALWRIIQFNRMIQETLPAPQRLQTIAADLARKLGLRRVPDIRLVDGVGIPMVWCVGRGPIIALPARLSSQLDEQQTSMVLAHELAHLKRRDHWVRGVELVISVIYWWNPLVWWTRRKLHELEELCCDAWVAWAFPNSKKCYADALLKAATLAGPAPRPAPALASSFLNRGGLKERIEALLDGRMPRQVSPGAALLLAAVAILLLPSVALSVNREGARSPSTPHPQDKPVPATSTAAAQGKIVGKVTVSGTDEPVSGATVRFMLGKTTKGLSIYHDAVTGETDANGRYSIDVPFGSVSVGRFDAPPGYWSEGGMPQQLVTSAASPVVTKDFSVRRGLALRLRTWDSTARKPIPGIQCIARSADRIPETMSWCDTDALGMARATLPGFHGEFRLVVVEFWEPTGRWESRPEPATLSIEPGFRIDHIRQIAPQEEAGTIRIIDLHGKLATLRHARASLPQGELLIDVDLKPVDPAKIGDVRGIVVDEIGQPIPGARVGLVASSIVTTGLTAADGRFSLREHWIRTAAEPGTKLRVAVIKDGFGGIDTRPIPRPDDPSVPINFGRIVLLPGKSIRVRVLDPSGKPARGAWVDPTRSWSSSSQIAMTDERGECEIRNLPAGATELHVSYGDSYANTTAFAGDGTNPLTIRLIPIPGEIPHGTPLLAPRAPNSRPPSLLGKPAPPLSVKEWTDGKSRSLADFKGKIVALNFWGIWSGPCGYAVPAIKNLEARFKDRDVIFIGIHTAGTDPVDVRNFLDHIKFNLPTAVDAGEDETAKQYGVTGSPTLILIGRDGRVEWSSRQQPEEDATKMMERAARSLSIPWPLNEKQPQEKLIEQGWRIQEFLFAEAIDRALAK